MERKIIKKIQDLSTSLEPSLENEISKYLESYSSVFQRQDDNMILENFKIEFSNKSPLISDFVEKEQSLLMLKELELTETLEFLNNKLDFSRIPEIRSFLESVSVAYQRKNTTNLTILSHLLEKLQNYRNVPEINELFNYYNSNFLEKYSEEIRIVDVLEKAKLSNFDDYVYQKIENILENFITDREKNTEKRLKILEDLKQYSAFPMVKNINAIISEQIQNEIYVKEDLNFNVTDIYSFTYLNKQKSKMIFGNTRNLFEMDIKNQTINYADKKQYQNLFEIVELNAFLNTRKNSIEGNKVTIGFNNDILEFVSTESSKKAFLNGKEINEDFRNFMDKISKVEIIRNKNKIVRIFEELDNLIKVDFGKNIISKKDGSYTSIFKLNESYFVDLVNNRINETRFLFDSNEGQVISEVRNFLGYDMRKHFKEFVDIASKEMSLIKSKLIEKQTTINELKTMLNEINKSLNDNKVDLIIAEELAELRNEMIENIDVLKNEAEEYKAQLREFVEPDVSKNIQITEEQKSAEPIFDLPTDVFKLGQLVYSIKHQQHGRIIDVNDAGAYIVVLLNDGENIVFSKKELGDTFTLNESIHTDNLMGKTIVLKATSEMGMIQSHDTSNDEMVLLLSNGHTKKFKKEEMEFEILDLRTF